MSFEHFEGKSALEHLKDARFKTKQKLKENHAVETKSFIDAIIRTLSDSGFIFGILTAISFASSIGTPFLTGAIVLGFIVFKTLQSALDGWAKLERLHRVIEEERYEIEHHEEQERLELKMIYEGKGIQGRLLEEVLDILMADRNRLLSIMLEEELGLKVESYEHPLKQALGALIGGALAFIPIGISLFFTDLRISFIAAAIAVFAGAYLKAHFEKIARIKTIVWHLANLMLLIGLIYFGIRLFS